MKKSLISYLFVYTISVMNITFDPAKERRNLSKHHVSLNEAKKLEWDWLLVMPDIRRDYGELRMIGYAPIGDRIYCVVFVDRDEERRIISLRKANDREVKRYASEI
jgi:hypothetical protein